MRIANHQRKFFLMFEKTSLILICSYCLWAPRRRGAPSLCPCIRCWYTLIVPAQSTEKVLPRNNSSSSVFFATNLFFCLFFCYRKVLFILCFCRSAVWTPWKIQRGEPVQQEASGVVHGHTGPPAIRLQVGSWSCAIFTLRIPYSFLDKLALFSALFIANFLFNLHFLVL